MKRTDPVDRALTSLRAREWRAPAHRERLGRALAQAFVRRRANRTRRLTLGLISGLGLAGATYAGVELLDRWRVTTTVSGTEVGTREVQTDARGRGFFRVPVDGLDTDRFQFEREGSDAVWVHFDIEVVDGVAEVAVQEFDAYPIDLGRARAILDEFAELAGADAGALWGVPLDGPLLLIDPVTRFAVANQSDGEGYSREVDGVHIARLPADVGCANTTVEWAGVRWTMLLWPLPTDSADRARLLMHEAFHRAQVGLGLYRGGDPCPHLEGFDGRFWLRLEARALAVALESGPSSAGALADALLFRAQRRALDERAGPSEDALERLEGTAEYTGVRLASPDRAARRRAAIAILRGIATRPTLARSFAYVTGPAYGLLLDELDESEERRGDERGASSWRSELLHGATLGDLAARAIGWATPSPTELGERAWTRAASYGRDDVEREELAREAAASARRAQLVERFVDGPVLVVPWVSGNYVFDPNRVEPLGDHGSVYGTLALRDAWGTADANGGALMGADLVARLPAPSDLDGPELAGDGWTLELAEDWTVEPGDREGDWVLVPRDG